MINPVTKTTELAMQVTLSCVGPGDLVVDATCGKGHDTLSLAKAVGENGRVFAFDIQRKAIDITDEMLKSSGYMNVELVNGSFIYMKDHVRDGSASAVVFNLGYLPGGDHRITTVAEVTIEGLKVALKTVKAGGIVTVVLYDGHEEGHREKQCVLRWAENLDAKVYHVIFANMLNQKNYPPEILWIIKKR